MASDFLIAAPPYTHKSAGIRALYRLCHHLNAAGYRAAMTPVHARLGAHPEWFTPLHNGPVGNSIVIYPETVSGNPLNAAKVVRWCLNSPGLLGGDAHYAASEMVFVFNPGRLALAAAAAGSPLGPERVVNFGLIDPVYFHPDPNQEKTLHCFYTGKERGVATRYPMPDQERLTRIEELPLERLGELLRRTRVLYSYDHCTNLLKEAAISGCEVLVMHEDGILRDPATCGCAYNIYWEPEYRDIYVHRFHDSGFVGAFVEELRTRWPIPEPRPQLARRLFFQIRRALHARLHRVTTTAGR